MSIKTLDELKHKCIAEGRSLQWMLTVLAQEEVISRIMASSFAEASLIKGGYVLQALGSNNSGLLPKLEISVTSEVQSILPEDLKSEKGEFIHVKELTPVGEGASDGNERYLVKAVCYGIPLVFYMYVEYGGKEQGRFYGRELPRLSGEGEAFSIRYMYPEGIFYERLWEALAKGETLDSMETWYDMLYLSGAMMLDGHRLGEIMSFGEYSAGQALDFAGKLSELTGSKMICNRWRAFARENRVPLREFPDLAEHLSSIIAPISEASKGNNEFFGTWMPELCRYID